MHAMIPLAKSLPCIKISLPLKSEAKLTVYSHHACSIVILVDMGMTATFKKPHTHSLHALPVPTCTCHIDMISMLNTAKICWQFPYENFGPDRGRIRPDLGGNTVERTKHRQNKNRTKKMSGSKLISQTNVTLVSGSRQPYKTLTGTEQEPNNLKLLFQN